MESRKIYQEAQPVQEVIDSIKLYNSNRMGFFSSLGNIYSNMKFNEDFDDNGGFDK